MSDQREDWGEKLAWAVKSDLLLFACNQEKVVLHLPARHADRQRVGLALAARAPDQERSNRWLLQQGLCLCSCYSRSEPGTGESLGVDNFGVNIFAWEIVPEHVEVVIVPASLTAGHHLVVELLVLDCWTAAALEHAAPVWPLPRLAADWLRCALQSATAAPLSAPTAGQVVTNPPQNWVMSWSSARCRL